MELDELHVDQLGPGEVRKRLAVAGVLPRVRRDLVRPADPAGREHDRLGREEHRLTGRPPVAEGPLDPIRPGEEVGDRALHVDLDAGRHRAILERPDHLEPGPVPDVGEPRIGVAAEGALEDPPVAGPIEDRPPELELADAVRSLLRVQLGHPRVVHELAADHRVAEVDLPVVALVDMGHCGGDASFGHDRVGLAEERLADQPDRCPAFRGLDRRPQPGPARTDHEDVVGILLGGGAVIHRRIAGSTRIPSARRRM